MRIWAKFDERGFPDAFWRDDAGSPPGEDDGAVEISLALYAEWHDGNPKRDAREYKRLVNGEILTDLSRPVSNIDTARLAVAQIGEINLASVALIRAWLAKQKDCPKELASLEAQVQQILKETINAPLKA